MQRQVLIISMLFSLLSCGGGGRLWPKSTGDISPAEALTQTTGCLAGVLMDGVTGARIDVAGAGVSDNIFVLAGNNKFKAAPVLADGQAAARPNLVGEYTLCDVPLEAALPLYVALSGYQPMHADIYIASTDASLGHGADSDLPSSLPTAQANIQLFPVAPAAQNFTVVVSYAGAVLPGATVFLVPTGEHVLAQGVNFVTPDVTGFKTLQAATDASGVATFNAADLSLGSVYNYSVLPADSSIQKSATGTLSIGYITAPGEPYNFHVALGPVKSELVVVSSSLDGKNYSLDGSVTYYFNRPVEVVPGGLDGITATLDHQKNAKLVPDVPGNKVSEQVNVQISGQSMTLKPNFATAPDPATEQGVGITYNNVQVRPTTGQQQVAILTLAPNVKVFGGEGVPSVVTTLNIVSGNNQTASPSSPLLTPLVAQVLDQYGAPMAGVLVTFAVTAGNGSIQPLAPVSTKANGQAQINWQLGPAGAQQVIATVDGIVQPVTFNATFLPATSLAQAAGNNQSVLIGTVLPLALQIHALDKNFVAAQGSPITFTVDDQTNGGTLSVLGGAPAGTQTVITDASGNASLNWTLGTHGGPFTVTVTSGTSAAVKFTATAQAPTTLAKVSGDAQSASANTQLSNPIVVVVRDQNNNLLPGVIVQFSTATTGGTLTTNAGAAATVTITTGANGQAQATWKVGTTGGATANSATVSIPSAAGVAPLTFTATAN